MKVTIKLVNGGTMAEVYKVLCALPEDMKLECHYSFEREMVAIIDGVEFKISWDDEVISIEKLLRILGTIPMDAVLKNCSCMEFTNESEDA